MSIDEEVRCIYAHNSKLLKRHNLYRLKEVIRYDDGTCYVKLYGCQYQFAARRFERAKSHRSV